MSKVESTETMLGNTNEPEVIYGNDSYRVEKIGVDEGDGVVFRYAVINNNWDVIEVETVVLAQALNDCEALQDAVDKFYQEKAFENVGSATVEAPKVIETV